MTRHSARPSSRRGENRSLMCWLLLSEEWAGRCRGGENRLDGARDVQARRASSWSGKGRAGQGSKERSRVGRAREGTAQSGRLDEGVVTPVALLAGRAEALDPAGALRDLSEIPQAEQRLIQLQRGPAAPLAED